MLDDSSSIIASSSIIGSYVVVNISGVFGWVIIWFGTCSSCLEYVSSRYLWGFSLTNDVEIGICHNGSESLIEINNLHIKLD